MFTALISFALLFVSRCHSTIIQTNGSILHFFKGTIDCPDGEPCSIYCDTPFIGPGVCEGAVINCPTDAQCDLFCGTPSFSCRFATINCPVTADCNVYCSGGGQNICNGIRPNWSPNGQNRLTCEGTGHSMCSGIQDFPVPPPDEPMVLNCQGTYKCYSSNIICPSNANCTINCHADHACANAVITWSDSGINTLDCPSTFTDPCLNIISSTFTLNPTNDPSMEPTIDPTNDPSMDPSFNPTNDPSMDPTNNPSKTASVVSTNYTISIDMNECANEEICDEKRQDLEQRIIAVLSNVTYIERQVIDGKLVIRLSVKTQSEQVLDVDYIRYHIEKEIEDSGGSNTFGDVSVGVDDVSMETTESGNDLDQSLLPSFIFSKQVVFISVICVVVCAIVLCVLGSGIAIMKRKKERPALDLAANTTYDVNAPEQKQTTDTAVTLAQTNQNDLQPQTMPSTQSASTTGEMANDGAWGEEVKSCEGGGIVSDEEACKDKAMESDDAESESNEAMYDNVATGGDTMGGDATGIRKDKCTDCGAIKAGDGMAHNNGPEHGKCADCGKMAAVRMYDTDGLFYCNVCWANYE